MSYNVHHFADEASVELARKVVEELPGAVAIREPVDDVTKSGVRIYDEDRQRWVLKHEWVRGSEKNLDHLRYQIVKGLTRPAYTKTDNQLRKELGQEPLKGPGFGVRRRKA